MVELVRDLISLFGWFLAIRGLVLLAAPQLIERAAARAVGAILILRLGFGALFLVGLRLTLLGWIEEPPPPLVTPDPSSSQPATWSNVPALLYIQR